MISQHDFWERYAAKHGQKYLSHEEQLEAEFSALDDLILPPISLNTEDQYETVAPLNTEWADDNDEYSEQDAADRLMLAREELELQRQIDERDERDEREKFVPLDALLEAPQTSPPNSAPACVERVVDGEKPVNYGTHKHGSRLRTRVLSKRLAMAQTSILSSNPSNALMTGRKAKTLLSKLLPKDFVFLPWERLKDTDKLLLATGPILDHAAAQGYECKPFTLVLTEQLSKRLDEGDKTAPAYIRDQMVRQIKKVLGPDARFMYALEKAPARLSDESSRHRWHIHGVIAGPAGFSAQRNAPIRRALKSLKGEAKNDFMFSAPNAGYQSALRWSVYCAKNEMTVTQEPSLKEQYDLLPGKATFISRQLLLQTREQYESTVLPYIEDLHSAPRST